MSNSASNSIGLVLSGGGARGAYQVGVLKALFDVISKHNLNNSIDILTGVSAGAINASFLAAYAEDMKLGAYQLAKLWSSLQSDHVFYTDALSLGKIGLKWMGELSLGGLTGTTPGRALLDTAPLKDLLHNHINFKKIESNLQSHIKALAVTAMDYRTSSAITFVQGHDQIPAWNKVNKRSERTEISSEHIMASSSIPLLFPPIKVDDRYFGDGCVRNANPCGPAIYLGAKKLIIIGVRKTSTTAYEERVFANDKTPSVARVVNVLLNAVLLDGVEQDVERLERVNELVTKVPCETHGHISYKKIDYLWIAPSQDIGEIAASKSSRLPRVIRYLLKGLGSLEDASEIISYLLFDSSFCSQLIEIGYEDGMKKEKEIIALFNS